MAPPQPLGIAPTPAADPVAQMNTFCSYVTMLAEQSSKDENKLKAAQELNENFEVIISSSQYTQFLEHSIKIFLKILQESQPHFISEYSIQQVRKLILEMIHRLPTNELLRPYVKPILTVMFKLLETENEENVLVLLRIIIEMHKQYRPAFNPDIQRFMQFVKGVYHDLPKHLNSIFEPRQMLNVQDLSDLNFEQILSQTYTITSIQCEKKLPDGSSSPNEYQTFNLLPKAVLSLKVLQELPIIVVLLYQLYKQNVQMDISEFIPLIMTTITLQPTKEQRLSPHFNKEVFVDFMGAQIKTLSFLAYIIRLYQEIVAKHADQMVKGILGLLTLCPNEVAHLRKEMLVAARHILATDLRTRFVVHMETLFDENILLGKGCTSYESLRPLAYSTLADLVHHVRQSLPTNDLARSVQLFAKNVHDETLPTTIQTMSCKVLLNLVDCIRQRSDSEKSEKGHELLMRMLEIFVLKFKTISKLQLSFIPNRNHPPPTMSGYISLPYLHNPLMLSSQSRNMDEATKRSYTTIKEEENFDTDSLRRYLFASGDRSTPTTPAVASNQIVLPNIKIEEKPDDLVPKEIEKTERSKFAFPVSQCNNMNTSDFRSLIKTLVCGIKTVTWGCALCKNQPGEPTAQNKQFHPKETVVFINLVKWALKALDLYTLSGIPANAALGRTTFPITTRKTEEKEVLEHFSGVFSMLHTETFQEIFATTIEYMVEQIYKNLALLVIANSFLANPTTSPIFATVLVEYLLERMEEMGSNFDRSNLYLRLFKLVFGSVSLFPAENEHMLRPHLHRIVNMSMELAMTAKEPYNYFLLLRALFRSIGGGSHDLLYQEFLPLLPNLLEGLNRLQSGLHKQQMKDLFIELCLTVPVRLSSLLPYLPMLMDPLVSALNGSHTLISQGLRTLELCVDNLQPDFLYDHIQPVRADLMQALWRTLRNPDNVAHVAFRVLGKFGGGNRKMMVEPQRLDYNDNEAPGASVIAFFQDHESSVSFSVDKVIDMAFTSLKYSTTESFYRRQCWEVIRCYLAASLNLDDEKSTLMTLFLHPSFKDGAIMPISGTPYKSPDTVARNTHQTALTGMFVAAAIKELRHSVLNTMICIVRHYTMVAVAQQAGPFPLSQKQMRLSGIDPLVLLDAISVIMGHEEKELCKPGHLSLVLIIQTASKILGSTERASQLPFMEYMSEKLTSLCYERAWYAKLGGCIAIKFFIDEMSKQWIFEHMFVFLKAFLFVMMDLTGEVSSGAIDMAKANLENMLRVCCGPLENVPNELSNAQTKAMNEVIHELVRQVTSPHTIVREQSMHSLRLIAELQKKTVTAVMDPHRDVLVDMIPPRKHFLRHQPANAQIGLMDGNTFCTTLEPRLFTIDITEHKVFFQDLISLCDVDDTVLNKLPCYKAVSDLIPLRKSALRALAACHYIQEGGCRENIFTILYKALEKPNFELQQAGFECMKKFIAGFQIDKEIVHQVILPLLLTLGDYRNLTLNGARRLYYLSQLFPSTCTEKLCKQLLQHVEKLLDIINTHTSTTSKSSDTEQKIVTIIEIFQQIPAASPKFLESLCQMILQTENHLLFETSSPYREPLIKFLLCFPTETMEFIVTKHYMVIPQWSRFLYFLLKHKNGGPFRETLQNQTDQRIMTLLTALVNHSEPIDSNDASVQLKLQNYAEMQYVAIKIVVILMKHDEKWLSNQTRLINAIKNIWNNEEYQTRMSAFKHFDFSHWKEPKLVVKILLKYFCYHPEDIDLLFQLLRVMTVRFIPDFQVLRDFLENTVAVLYDYNWKRAAFFRFVEHFTLDIIPQELKAKVLQMIIIPCFATSFEHGEGQALIGGPPMPYNDDNPNSVVSVFIHKVIDPDNPFGCSDSLRIALLQLACLFVEQAPSHIHDANNKRQGNKLRRLMTFAWPCLLVKNCVDPATRYHGHLLLSHIIAKYAIHKRIVLQVFHSLLKAHALEARVIVRQALEVLTPAMPVRMEDGNIMLTHWTKKIIVEEGHSMAQLFHILQLVVKQYKVYYPVRHQLVQHMVASMQRLGFSMNATIEHRKLAVELAEVIIKWDLQRLKEDNETMDSSTSTTGSLKRPSDEPMNAPEPAKKIALEVPNLPTPSTSTTFVGSIIPVSSISEPNQNRPIDRIHADAVLNFLLKLACQVNDRNCEPPSISFPGEILSRRCVNLIKTALKPWTQQCEFKISWIDKILLQIDIPSANLGNICTALELLTYLLSVFKKEQILAAFKPLQRGLAACIVSTDTKVIKLVHGLLFKLMSIYPPEPSTSSKSSKYEELETIYSCVGKMVSEGLGTYEKNPKATTSSLFGTFMMLKAACMNTPSYIDRLITPFMRVLHRMSKDHLNTSGAENNNPVASELLCVGLDLVKTRVVVMGEEMRKVFIGNILVSLIERTPDIKVMKAIVKMLEEWMKYKNPVTLSQAPSLREKSILLVKMMQYVEKRFSEDLELTAQFLELVNYVYRDEQLKTTELPCKLEPAFCAGLRCTQPHIRAKFFEVFDGSIRRRLYDRLLYIVCSQNWDAMGPHYWIKQCIELLLVTTVSSKQIEMSSEQNLLPSIASVINLADKDEKINFVIFTSENEQAMRIKQENIEQYETDSEDVLDIDISGADSSSVKKEQTVPKLSNKLTLPQIISVQSEFLEDARKVRTEQLLVATAQLCHMDTPLAEKIWLDLFPKLWSILDKSQQNALSNEIVPFVCSGTHVIQKDCQPSSIATFVEALSSCTPTVPLNPDLMKYLCKSHNLWHRMTLTLEQMALDCCPGSTDFEPDTSPQTNILNSLSDMYSQLCEEDMWSGLWQKHAHYKETNIAIAYEQQGFFEQAQGAYDIAMSKHKQDCALGPAPINTRREALLWEHHWIRCAKELNQWDLLLDYGMNKADQHQFLILESAWRVPNWNLMKEALAQVEYSCPKEMQWRVNLYRGFLAICRPEEQHPKMVDRYVELCSGLCMREWRRLPHIVSHIHLPLLQAAQQIMELQEAAHIHQGLLGENSSSLHDMKAIVKTWRNRLPVISDDLSHWSDIFTWRQHHYQFIASHYDKKQEVTPSTNHGMLGVHASAQAIIHFGKIARKHNLTGVCLDSLSRIYTIPSVPIVDCFQKIRQQVKCCLQMASYSGKNELQEGLEVIELTNLEYFSNEMTAEFYALKGMLLAMTGRSEEANKAFSTAARLHPTLVKAWALWGDYLENIFTKDPKQVSVGISAITCFLHACRHQNESKSRKYLAKVLWMMSYDEKKGSGSLMDAVDKYAVGVPPLQWLPWIPQLVVCLVQYEGNVVLNLLSQVGRMFPQAVYFPIRTLYLTLKIEQRERYKSAQLAAALAAKSGKIIKPNINPQQTSGVTQIQSQPSQSATTHRVGPGTGTQAQSDTTGPIKATPPMLWCSKIMHMQRDIHPTVLSSLEGIVDQMVWFRENWYEEVLRQLRQGLAKCHAIAFEYRGSVNEATITPHTVNFVKKLVSTFGIGIENISSSVSGTFSSAASESLARRAQATVQDPVFQKMKGQFTSDFDFTQPGAMNLHSLIGKLKKWIKILEAKTKLLPKSFLIEEKCRFLSNFSLKTAEVELPGEFLLPRLSQTNYCIRIARFMPRVEIVQKHNTAARRLFIRGHNGKIYPYLVVNDSGLGDARREERVLQLLRMLNHYLGKQKETSRRFLHFTVPRVVAVSPQMRLVEDNPSSISLLDIYKRGCTSLSIEHDTPVARYYERLASVQTRGSQASHQVLRDILKEVQCTMVPRTMLKNWALKTFASATDYWTFRKMFTLQLSLTCFSEYVLHLTRLNPDMMYIHQDSGLVNVSYYKFDVDDMTCELDANRPVPFRLTPNIVEYLSTMGINGPLTASTIASARCLIHPTFKVQTILRTILRDEMVAGYKKRCDDKSVESLLKDRPTEIDTEQLITLTNKAVTAVINRLNSLSTFDGVDSKASTLVAAANSHDNLCRMDPAWHPWL